MNSELPPLIDPRENPNLDHYMIYAACNYGEGGFILCHTPKGRKHLTILDFYRSNTSREYDGPVTALPRHLQERVSAQQEKSKAEKVRIEAEKRERTRAYESRRDHP